MPVLSETAFAFEIVSQADRVGRHDGTAELRMLENRLQRRQFQQQQQQQRQQDRQVVPLQQKPEVPRVRQNCQIIGRSQVGDCR